MSRGAGQTGEGDDIVIGEDAGVRHRTYRAADGLPLHVAVYGPEMSPWLPVICLPGLSRSAQDFGPLATHLSTHRHRPRRVYAFDYRGRGLSAHDAEMDNYSPLVEMRDVLDGMATLGVERAIIVGTSRGGILAMMMGVARPGILAGVILNDIGPVIEPLGLARIKTYVGRTPAPDDWNDAVRILKRLHGGQFTGLDDEDWIAYARMTYRDEDGRPVVNYDPALARTFDGIEFDGPVPTLWNEFNTLRNTPLMAIRGGNSDLLSADTVAAMAAAHPGLDTVTIDGEGHAPLLLHTPILQRISAFITGAEGPGPHEGALIPRKALDFDLDATPDSADAG